MMPKPQTPEAPAEAAAPAPAPAPAETERVDVSVDPPPASEAPMVQPEPAPQAAAPQAEPSAANHEHHSNGGDEVGRQELYPRPDAVIAHEAEPEYVEDHGGLDDEGSSDAAVDEDGGGEDEVPETSVGDEQPSGMEAPGTVEPPPAESGTKEQRPAPQPQSGQPRREGRHRRRGRGGRGGGGGEGGRTERGGDRPERGQPRDRQERGAERERPDRGHDRDRRGGHERSAHHQRGGHEREYRSDHRSPAPAVKREILANTNFEETRIAILDNGRMAELLWERKSSKNIVGNIYKGVVENVLPGISSAFVNIGFDKNAYLYISDVLGDKGAAIDSTLKKGQHIMIQVAKEAIGTKGMKVTMDVSLPGRFLVFTPFQTYVGISKHIGDAEERARLSGIVDRLVAEHLGGKGVVVRTEAEGASEADLEREVKYLLQTWTAIQKKFDTTPPPTLLHKDLDLALQVARDLLSEKVYVYLLDNKEQYKNVVEFVEAISPELKDKVRIYDAKTPMFKAFHLEGDIENMRRTKVPLPNGGSIIIQEAESLCAIDVNTGRFTGSKSQEETVTQTNVEAALEVAHQLRLRNIGGIIVVDFIDMRKASNRQKVMEAFAHACKGDRAKIRILPITRLGLVELTRERKRESTVSLLTEECPQCKGCGRVLSGETLRIRIQREIALMTGGRPGGQVRLLLNPGLADQFRGQLAVIEKNVQRSIKIGSDPQLPWEEYRIVLE
ncbi:MAG: Rne/Rng family ribonuclease [Elusimicrobiota bacterium]